MAYYHELLEEAGEDDGKGMLAASDVADVVLASGCLSAVLESAAAMGKDELLQALLQRLKAGSSSGQQWDVCKDLSCPLLAAAGEDRPQCLGLLLAACASSFPESLAQLLDAKDDEGRTALMWAARKGHVTCVELLLQHSPETQVAAVDAHGWNALMYAAARPSIMQLLLAHDPDLQVAAVSSGGMNALTCAISCPGMREQTACAELLLAHSPGVQLAAETRWGMSALSYAVVGAHVDCLKLLLAHTPPQQQLDNAVHRACQELARLSKAAAAEARRVQGLRQCMALLLRRGATLGMLATAEEAAMARSIVQELAGSALVPDVGLAIAASHNSPGQASML